MARPPRLHAAAGVLAALLVAGCGGDEEPDAERFRRQATAACERYNAGIRSIRPAQSVAELPRLIDQADPLLRRLGAELKDVDAPDELADDHARLIAGAQDARRRLAALRSAARAGDPARLRTLAGRAQAADRRVDRLARSLRLPACAKS